MKSIQVSLDTVFVVYTTVLQNTPTPNITEARKMQKAIALMRPFYNQIADIAKAKGEPLKLKNDELRKFRAEKPEDKAGADVIHGELMKIKDSSEEETREAAKAIVTISGNQEDLTFIKKKVEDYFERNYKEKGAGVAEDGVAGDAFIDPLVAFCDAVENAKSV